MTDEREDRITRILDSEDIRQALFSYARGVDRRDADLIRAAYHDDAWDDHGNFAGGPDDVVRAIMASKPSSAVTASMHQIGNILIEFDGEAANVETYFIAYQRRENDGKTYTRTRAGRYLDRFERRDARWRIAKRAVADDWSRLDEVVAVAAEVGPSCALGARDRTDVSYGLSEFRPV